MIDKIRYYFKTYKLLFFVVGFMLITIFAIIIVRNFFVNEETGGSGTMTETVVDIEGREHKIEGKVMIGDYLSDAQMKVIKRVIRNQMEEKHPELFDKNNPKYYSITIQDNFSFEKEKETNAEILIFYLKFDATGTTYKVLFNTDTEVLRMNDDKNEEILKITY